eukprot:scaffold59359_cov22-Prasinocladus_malaysianus.AAC.1
MPLALADRSSEHSRIHIHWPYLSFARSQAYRVTTGFQHRYVPAWPPALCSLLSCAMTNVVKQPLRSSANASPCLPA